MKQTDSTKQTEDTLESEVVPGTLRTVVIILQGELNCIYCVVVKLVSKDQGVAEKCATKKKRRSSIHKTY